MRKKDPARVWRKTMRNCFKVFSRKFIDKTEQIEKAMLANGPGRRMDNR